MRVMFPTHPGVTKSKPVAPTFGVTPKFQDVVPTFETSGRTTAAKLALELRKNTSGDPRVRVIKSQQSLNALNAALGTPIPVNFKTHGVLVVSKENGDKIGLASMNTDAADPTNTLNVKLKTEPWKGVHASLLSVSYYIAVVPKDQLVSKPRVSF